MTAARTRVRKPAVKKEVAAPRQAIIPEKSFYDSYVSRVVIAGDKARGSKDLTDFDIFERAFARNENVLLEGPTGCAKTSAILAYAAYKEVPFYAIPSNIGIEPSQLFGKFVPMPNGSIEWVDGPVTSIVRNGGVLLINEVNFMPDRVATVLFGLLDKRRQITLLDHNAEVIDANEDLLIVADMNPEYEGTRPLNKAFRNRFSVQIPWGYDNEVEKKLLKSKSLIDMAEKLRVDADNGGLETPCSTNMLMEFESNYNDMGYDYAAFMFISHYQAEERGAVRLIMDTYRDNLDRELDEKARKAEERARKAEERKLAKLRKELESLIDPVREDKQRVVEADDPENEGHKTYVLVDDEWGIEGLDWEWTDEDDDSDDDDSEEESDDDVAFDDDDEDDELDNAF
ncbi:porphyrin biosynthesis [Gordonia phage GMA6]|uniref:ATPase family protein n=1 Tax=Gordonia phage GMA6 TaxID=1647285 RepID=A0A0K0NLB1_9CAUD|nr:porphyrin biosynthesis [Gordonia phage GMA6]AKL88342.1 ATPase family protein [Gordonia phage GMA6]